MTLKDVLFSGPDVCTPRRCTLTPKQTKTEYFNVTIEDGKEDKVFSKVTKCALEEVQ